MDNNSQQTDVASVTSVPQDSLQNQPQPASSQATQSTTNTFQGNSAGRMSRRILIFLLLLILLLIAAYGLMNVFRSQLIPRLSNDRNSVQTNSQNTQDSTNKSDEKDDGLIIINLNNGFMQVSSSFFHYSY